MSQVAYVAFGSVYDAMHGNIIETPAIIVDTSSGCMHKYGEADNVRRRYDEMYRKLVAAGLKNMAGDLFYLELNPEFFTAEERCYVLRRCVEYSASPFPKELCERARTASSTDDVRTWLRAEMTRIPIRTDQEGTTRMWRAGKSDHESTAEEVSP